MSVLRLHKQEMRAPCPSGRVRAGPFRALCADRLLWHRPIVTEHKPRVDEALSSHASHCRGAVSQSLQNDTLPMF